MSKADPASHKKERNKTIRWVVTIFIVTIFISATISLISEEIMAVSGMVVAFVVSIFVIKFLMGYIKKHDFKVFGWYRIVLGAIVLICGFAGLI